MKPCIGITLGDPSGIGPEITCKLFADPSLWEICRPVIIGDACILERAKKFTHHPELLVHSMEDIKEALFVPGTMDVLNVGIPQVDTTPIGEVSALSGEAAFSYVRKVIGLAMAKEVDATVTNPLNKEALHLAGEPYPGHTEIYAAFTGTTKYTMLLVHETLRVVHVSTHVSLREACDRVKKDRVLEVIRIAQEACESLGISHPKIGVAGLNPHSGENGLFGTEEQKEIIPAIEEARKEGMQVEGPVPPDSIFPKARGGFYDIVVAMYHDQGHIPLKVCGFVYDPKEEQWQSVSGVNITLGLPIIRTSVDHGTAFDQAGKGTASEDSLRKAVEYAVQMAKIKQERENL